MICYGIWKVVEATAFVAIDLSVAFNTIDHRILLDVLQHHFGVTGIARMWFESYLSPRQYKVNIGKEYSEPIDLELCVILGSCTGPILFLLYASTIAEVETPPIDIHGYANDHGVKDKFRAECNINKIELSTIQNLEQCLDSIKTWTDLNHLKMNSSKTEFILMYNQQYKCKWCRSQAQWLDLILGGTTWLITEYDTTHHFKMQNCHGESVKNQTDMAHVD